MYELVNVYLTLGMANVRDLRTGKISSMPLSDARKMIDNGNDEMDRIENTKEKRRA